MTSLRAKTIAIIGAGPSGLVAAKYLRAERAFDRIVIFEQRNQAGGIWNYTPDDRTEDIFAIPQTNPAGKNQAPAWREPRSHNNGVNGVNKVPTFLSPVYDKLETNIPRGLMGFQDLPWPQDSQLFPKHETVLEYVQDYGKDVQDLVEYSTQVTEVEAADSKPDGRWTLTTLNLITNSTQETTFDAVIVANGHFIVPYIPDINGIREWNAAHPNLITHSKYFRHPSEFSGKKVIVVGNSASGVDISTQIASTSSHPLLWSVQSASMFTPAPSTSKRELPPIAKFLPASRGVEFEDGSVEHDIDAIVFATGYFYSLPFLQNVAPALIGDGTHVQHTYQHLFYAPRPTLSLLALNQRVIPFPIAEAQAAVLARVYSGRLPLPSLPSMSSWEDGVKKERGAGRNFHVLSFPQDGNYINELGHWAAEAETRDGLENAGKGKMGPRWGDWEFWCREHFPAIRAAFGQKGEARHAIKKLEELGFDYQEYVEKKGREEGKLI
ncbi:FAD/NAD(P)-binding domain-containing protein [Melanomma pulvis-pyrius CBS 109.77]|uniref:FAD/NAD(P)-binding domain-containing protein n=1 Tax=Melanomma pulvis-pyrius CBS 109.77 TaxID=1314802 RepID=A0A6A6XDQ1_9PLEO|nr:FAD/NAD(P)-binding domain-containing protein [Melanomma pulvis-pyrius CBS 109.77]